MTVNAHTVFKKLVAHGMSEAHADVIIDSFEIKNDNRVTEERVTYLEKGLKDDLFL